MTTTISSSSSERTRVVPNSSPSNGMSLSPGSPDSVVSVALRNSPAMTIDSPSPTSTVVCARRTLSTGMAIPTTSSARVSEGSDTSGRTVSTIRPLSTTVGTKSRRTPNFLYSNTIVPSSKPVGSGYSPPEKNEADSPETAVRLGRASTLASPAVASASIIPERRPRPVSRTNPSPRHQTPVHDVANERRAVLLLLEEVAPDREPDPRLPTALDRLPADPQVLGGRALDLGDEDLEVHLLERGDPELVLDGCALGQRARGQAHRALGRGRARHLAGERRPTRERPCAHPLEPRPVREDPAQRGEVEHHRHDPLVHPPPVVEHHHGGAPDAPADDVRHVRGEQLHVGDLRIGDQHRGRVAREVQPTAVPQGERERRRRCPVGGHGRTRLPRRAPQAQQQRGGGDERGPVRGVPTPLREVERAQAKDQVRPCTHRRDALPGLPDQALERLRVVAGPMRAGVPRIAPGRLVRTPGRDQDANEVGRDPGRLRRGAKRPHVVRLGASVVGVEGGRHPHRVRDPGHRGGAGSRTQALPQVLARLESRLARRDVRQVRPGERRAPRAEERFGLRLGGGPGALSGRDEVTLGTREVAGVQRQVAQPQGGLRQVGEARVERAVESARHVELTGRERGRGDRQRVAQRPLVRPRIGTGEARAPGEPCCDENEGERPQGHEIGTRHGRARRRCEHVLTILPLGDPGDHAIDDLLAWSACALFAASAANDLARRRVANWIPLALLALFAAYALAGAAGPPIGVAVHVALGLALLVFGFVLWLGGKFGAGDSKLLAVAGLWVGPDDLDVFAFALAACAALLVAYALLPFAAARRVREALPFALAIAPPAVIVIIGRTLSSH